MGNVVVGSNVPYANIIEYSAQFCVREQVHIVVGDKIISALLYG